MRETHIGNTQSNHCYGSLKEVHHGVWKLDGIVCVIAAAALVVETPAGAQSLPQMLRQAETLEKGGDYEAAIAIYDQTLKIKPNQPLAYNSGGLAKHRLNDLDGVIADFSKAIQLRTDYASPYINRGYSHCKKGNLDAALSDLTKAIELLPKFVVTCRHRGLVKIGKSDFRGAIADYTKAIELDRDEYAA